MFRPILILSLSIFTGFCRPTQYKIVNITSVIVMDDCAYSKWEKLQQIKSKLATFLQFEDFSVICKAQKQICSHLLYFLNAYHSNFLTSHPFFSIFKQAIKIIDTLVISTEHEKYAHKLSYYAYVVQKYKEVTQSNQQLFSQELALARNLINEQSTYYNSIYSQPISRQELGFLKSNSTNCFFANLNNNQLILQNQQCLCCFQNFYKNKPLVNLNPYFPMVLGIGSVKAFQKCSIQKYVSAVCNQGGGILIIGAEKKGKIIKSIGMKFNNEESIQSCQKQIINAIKNVKPYCDYTLQRIPTYPNCINQQKEGPLICFRIAIFSNPPYSFTFLQSLKKGTQKVHKIYILDRISNEPLETVTINLYQKIHFLYQKGKKISYNSHKNIQCVGSKKLLEGSLVQTEQTDPQDIKFQQFLQQKFNYRSLLILSTQQMENIAVKFMNFIKELKQKFSYCKPFHKYFCKPPRPIWLVNHYGSHEELAARLKQFKKRQELEQGLYLMVLDEIIEIEQSVFCEPVERDLKLQLMQCFKQQNCFIKKSVQVVKTKNQLNKKVTYLKFKDTTMSLFAYMFLNEKGLRSHFINQDQCLVNF